MNAVTEKNALQLRSLIKNTGELELSLASVPIPTPADNEVLIRIEASPINPSDIGLLFGAADMSTATVTQGEHGPMVTARVPEKGM
jgi:NADPH2:quinone reductase